MISAINPTVKAIAVLIPGILLGLTFDVFTPLVYLLFIISVTFLLSDLSFKRWIKFFVPFFLFIASFSWARLLYTSETFQDGSVLFSFWAFEVTTGGLLVAVSLALRSLCFIALSLLFIMTTDSTKFMLSLMQQLRLSPKITYGVLAGYRFLPTFKHELEVLRQAHRVRGVGRAKGIRGRIRQFKRYSIPLLANSIRKAERVANAMESKGFTGEHDRTHYHQMTVTKRDWRFLGMMVGALFLAFVASYYFGYLNIFGYQVN
ncbi:energy-coupling factor transporter transmembrane component T family protein [Alkalibacillus salilacus]|uniref:Energy-coupling factor transport system permease protein n=1 Tax=Alkalibacillus salilacus TaxID=284582 RepID=A0ABT9VEK3_9BACI|nr:energy-coupling factor transporter transmembrane component T [Alkalibacillus salilacus]MDQ0159334.1 energy-coupling factor transport system permease protein [Alkalibacillus salilacus]